MGGERFIVDHERNRYGAGIIDELVETVPFLIDELLEKV
jgi:hypothetical protein